MADYLDKDIYGLEVDLVNMKFTRLAGASALTAGKDFDSVRAFGGRRRCILADNGTVVAYYGDAAFTVSGKLTKAVDLNPNGVETPNEALRFSVGTPVQVMVEQPKFYYKVVPLLVEERENGGVARKIRYYVSDTPKEGFKLHPAFIENGKENEKIYLAAFEGALCFKSDYTYINDDSQITDFDAYMLSSVANVQPASGRVQNLTRANTRKLAENRGLGWEQAYAATASASLLLMLIEYAAFNMQSAVGIGVTNKPGVEDAGNYSELTGATVNLGDHSGVSTNENGWGFVSYRGEENFWGNIWWWIDGINSFVDVTTGTDRIYVADHDFTDDIGAAPYQEVGMTPALSNGYISAFCYSQEYDWLFIAAETAGDDLLPVGDYFYQPKSTGWRQAAILGGWKGGPHAGAFCWSLSYDSAYRSKFLGGRLVYIPSKTVSEA